MFLKKSAKSGAAANLSEYRSIAASEGGGYTFMEQPTVVSNGRHWVSALGKNWTILSSVNRHWLRTNSLYPLWSTDSSLPEAKRIRRRPTKSGICGRCDEVRFESEGLECDTIERCTERHCFLTCCFTRKSLTQFWRRWTGFRKICWIRSWEP